MSDASPSAIAPAARQSTPAQRVCAPTVREWPGLSIPALADGPRSRHRLFHHAVLFYDLTPFKALVPGLREWPHDDESHILWGPTNDVSLNEALHRLPL